MVIVITGASSGIGLEVARLFAKDSNNFVYALNRSEVKEDNIYWIKCDVSDTSSISKAIEQITSKHPNIDVLINNAGMGISGAVEYHNEDEIRKIIDVNLVGLINVTRLSLPHMKNGCP